MVKYKKISACCIVLPHLKQKVKVQSSRAIVLPVEFQTIIGSNKRYKGGKLYQLPPEKEKTVGDEEKMNPHEETNLRASDFAPRYSTTEPQKLYSELGHCLGNVSHVTHPYCLNSQF